VVARLDVDMPYFRAFPVTCHFMGKGIFTYEKLSLQRRQLELIVTDAYYKLNASSFFVRGRSLKTSTYGISSFVQFVNVRN
jgi:hypothetical protein